MSSVAVFGTNHFVSYGAALSFYGPVYGRATVGEVQKKMRSGEIVVGKAPELGPEDTLLIDKTEGRYKIQRRIKK